HPRARARCAGAHRGRGDGTPVDRLPAGVAMRTRALGVLLLAGILLPALGRAQGHDALTTRDGLDVWAVGDSGRFYRSLDGGASWGYGNLGSKPLHGVAARGARVFVVGD